MFGRREKVALARLNPARILRKSMSSANVDIRLFQRPSPGTAPGTLQIDPEAQKPVIRLIRFDADSFDDVAISSPLDLPALLDPSKVNWVNIQGLGDAQVLADLAGIFGIHRLAIEDVAHVHQRAKVEAYEKLLYVVLPMADEGAEGCFQSEQLSLFLCNNVVLTFEEWTNAALDPIRERIRRSGGIIRTRREDYLLYALIDMVIDNYFPALEKRAEASEDLELLLLQGSSRHVGSAIHAMKQDLLQMRRAIWPMREAIGNLQTGYPDRFKSETAIYLRDCQDHVNQLLDHLDSYREMIANLRELHLSNESQKSAEIMKLLTIFGAIFLPLNFIAAVYGMNFNTEHPLNMPELDWTFGYPFALALMIAVSGTLLAYFRLKGWLGGDH